MKYSALSTSVFAFLFVGIIPIYAQYASELSDSDLTPHPPRFVSLENMNKAILEPFDQSDIVLVGKIVEVRELREESKSEYGISVENYLKNPKPHDLIIVIGDGIAKKEITDFNEVNYYNDPVFQKDDRVFAYLSSKDGKYVVLPYSFAISKNLPTGPPPDNVWFTFFKSKFYGSEPITISGKIKKAALYTSVAEYGANQTGIIEIYNPNRAKYLSDALDIKPDGSFAYEFRIKGNLGISGDYEYNILDGFGSTGSTFEYISLPLQQFRSGIMPKDILCKDGFELVIRPTNGQPSCVKPQSVEKLTQRMWVAVNKAPKLTNPEIYVLTEGDETFQIPYSLKGAKLAGIIKDERNESIHVKLEDAVRGELIISIPRDLIDAKLGQSEYDDTFFVLIDGKEYLFAEKASKTERTLKILFPNGARDIEIIGTNWI